MSHVVSYPLSPLQSGMLFHQLREPDSGIDIEQIGCTLDDVDVPRFVQAWQLLAERHDALRTRFRWRDVEAPLQEVLPDAVLDVHEEDLRALDDDACRRHLDAYVDADRHRAFRLDALPLFRLAFFRTGERRHEFVWTFPHVILDGRSFVILLRELLELYRALDEGRAPELAPVRPYRDFIAWLDTRDQSRDERFWREALAGFDAPSFPDLGAPAAHAAAAPRYAEQAARLSRDESAALYDFVQRHGLTVNTMVQGAWAMLLARYARTDDVVFGATRACRRSPLGGDPGVLAMVGLFINTLPVRVRIPPGERVIDWLRRIREDQIAVRDVEHAPLTLVQALGAMPSGVPLFDTILVYENQRQTVSFEAIDPRCHGFWFREKTTYPVSVRGYGEPELLLRIEYYRDRFDDDGIARMLGHLCTLLREMVAKGEQPTSAVETLAPEERRELLAAWNDTAVSHRADRAGGEALLPELFALQVARAPDAVALELDGERMTYRELDARAATLGRALAARGVGPDVLVGVCMDRSFELFVALLGIHKAGGAHLPLDPEYPAERLAFMLDDARVSLLLTQERVARTQLASLGGAAAAAGWTMPTLLPIDTEWWRLAEEAASAPDPTLAGPQDLAYVIYTSGSTGRPKGVQIVHRGLANLMQSMRVRPGLDARDAMLAVTTVSFDMAVPELFLPLVVGARMVIAPRRTAVDGQALAALIERAGVTVVQATPVTWRMLLEVGWTNPRRATLLCGGEALAASLAESLAASGGRLWNMYGPTETTVWSAADLVTDPSADAVAPIGRPIDNTTFHVLDDRMRLVPIGVAGELHIGGAGVARGYLNRPGLTAERFVDNPWATPLDPRLYRTGDLVRRRPDGRLDFLGRMDGQVKLRGFRIELGEIEAALVGLDVVRNAAVVLRTDAGTEPRLVAYYVPADGVRTSAAELRAALATTLPAHMVPSAFVEMAELPVTPTGKIDRKALPAPETSASRREVVPPRDEVETRLHRIWEQVLGTRGFGVTDHFNDVGGHSLAAVKVFSRVEREFGAKIQLATMLKHDTVERLAALLRAEDHGAAARTDEWRCIVSFDTPGTGTPIFCLHPMSGNVLFYQYFAREVGAHHPVYGIQALGNWGIQEPQETIEEMVPYYAEEIRKVRPHGPYVFFGVSFGGLVALELARHFRERGEEVQMVVLYDTAAPGYPRFNLYGHIVHFARGHGGIALVRLARMFEVDPPRPDERPMRFRTARILAWNVRQTARWWFDNTRRDYLYWKFEHRNAPHDYTLPANLTRFRLATRRIVRRYRARYYPGKLTLFRAEVQPAGIVPDPTNGWGPLCAEVEIHSFPGGHLTGMRLPVVRDTARVFLECLARDVARAQTSAREGMVLARAASER